MSLTKILIPFLLLILLIFSLRVSATEQDRPLGILFVPPHQNQFKPQELKLTNVSTSLKKKQAQRTERNDPPLGILILPVSNTQEGKGNPPINKIFETQLPNTVIKKQHPPTKMPWNRDKTNPSRPLGTLLNSNLDSYKNNTLMTNTKQNLTNTKKLKINGHSEPPDMRSTKFSTINFESDLITFNNNTRIVTATGNVKVLSKDRSLSANKLIHNQASGALSAEGNVVIIEPSGEVIFGDKVEISKDLKNAIISNIGVILRDKARIAGTTGRRINGNTTELYNGVYSACDYCPDQPSSPLIWKIKAIKVTHNETKKIISYEDAWVEFLDFPVFYIPYFEHADPTVRRKTGFLYPSFNTSSDLGASVKTPYFWNISAVEDATFTPIIMTGAPPVLGLGYRKNLTDGKIRMDSSITVNSDNPGVFSNKEGDYDVHGHLLSEGNFDIDDSWRWGFQVNRTSADTYMRRFSFGNSEDLNSKIFTEAFKKRSYFSAQAHTFQGLQESDIQGEIPIILPQIDFNHIGSRDQFGGRTELDFNLLSMTRTLGTDTRRLSSHTKWENSFVGNSGEFYEISAGINAQLYHVNSLERASNRPNFSGFSHRVVPEIAADWRMPFIRREGNTSEVLEPIATFILSPYASNSDTIPNEDSLEMEFDDTNLFSKNRFSGLDRVEGGARFSYGLKWAVFGDEGGSSRFLIGQSWRPKTDDTFDEGSGLEDNFSDLVSRVDISPGEHFAMSYRTRFSPENLSPNRNEIELKTGIPAFTIESNYIFIDSQRNSEFLGREELNLSSRSQINRFWKGEMKAVRDMKSSEFRSTKLQLTYEDECVIFTTTGSRTFFEDRDIEPTDQISLNIILKTIGSIPSIGVL